MFEVGDIFSKPSSKCYLFVKMFGGVIATLVYIVEYDYHSLILPPP